MTDTATIEQRIEALEDTQDAILMERGAKDLRKQNLERIVERDEAKEGE